jgi:hypothetical protein
LVSFRVLPIEWGDLEALSSDAKALLAVFSLAATDQSILRRCIVASQHPPTGRRDLDIPATLQRLFFFRIWLGKIFEVAESVNEIQRKGLLKDASLLPILDEILAGAMKLKSHRSWNAALRLRNDSTFHYGFSPAKKSCVHADPSADCSIHWGENGVNSYFPMGEELAFGVAMGRQTDGSDEQFDAQTLLEILTDWGREGSKWIHASHSLLVRELLHKSINSADVMECNVVAPGAMVGQFGPSLPIFLQGEGRSA